MKRYIKVNHKVLIAIRCADIDNFVSVDQYENFIKFRDGFVGYGIIDSDFENMFDNHVELLSSTGFFTLRLTADAFTYLPKNFPGVTHGR